LSHFESLKTGSDSLLDLQYLNAIWNVINFKEAEQRLNAALKD